MPKKEVNYQEVYDLDQLCSETKDLKEFCNEMGVNYEKFMNWQRHQKSLTLRGWGFFYLVRPFKRETVRTVSAR